MADDLPKRSEYFFSVQITHNMAEPHVSNYMEGMIYTGTVAVQFRQIRVAYVILAYVHPQQ
jgi:hypothetical protein